jgi:hypothetical protein
VLQIAAFACIVGSAALLGGAAATRSGAFTAPAEPSPAAVARAEG